MVRAMVHATTRWRQATPAPSTDSLNRDDIGIVRLPSFDNLKLQVTIGFTQLLSQGPAPEAR